VHPLLDRQTVTLDLDATYIEHHGPVGSRQGTRGTYKGKLCWHPLLLLCRRDRRVAAREAA
jgi:hypothetical protein